MLYAILKPLMRFAIWLYYRSIQRQGMERLDRNEPMLIIANHTASFMDAMVVAVHLKRRIHFFARGDAFGNPTANKILRGLGLLPVFRLSEGKENLAQNDATNEEGIEVLKRGGAVLIFAEGASDIAKILKPLKKGPFRLAVNAARELDRALTIVPLGINYSDATRPHATLWLNGGNAIVVEPAVPGEETRVALRAMRATVAALAPLVLHVGAKENADEADLAIHVAEKYKGNPLSWTEVRRITEAFKEDVPPGEQSLPSRTRGILSNAFGVLTTPATLPGLLFHGIPLAAARYIVHKKVAETDFISPVFIGAALVFTTLWYVLCALVISVFSPTYWLLLLPLLAICGLGWAKLSRPAWQDILSGKRNTTLRE